MPGRGMRHPSQTFNKKRLEYNVRVPFIHGEPAVLAAHPSTPNEAVRALSARVRMEGADTLVFDYSLDADLSRLRVPRSLASAQTTGAGARADALWKHTCFEAFLAPADAAGYHEFNFSPSCDWAIYCFSAYREDMAPAKIGQAPQISVHRGDAGVELEARVRLESVGNLCAAPRLKVALAAVIEDGNGRLSYWALRHGPGKPDFHHPNAFVLEVARA
jgi:hypothetical protein